METEKILVYIFIGFLAQVIDGSLGMAYGVSTTTFLTTFGVPIRVASASVHTAEIFTAFASGIAHWKTRNVDWKIFKNLFIPGISGGLIGVYTVTLIPGNNIELFANLYLFAMGVTIICRVINKTSIRTITDHKIAFVGLMGGFLDAVGGGGWGPVVTATMVASGHPFRYTIGTVNMAEFFVTLVQVFAFSAFVGIGQYVDVIIGLAIGGVIAAPLASILCKKIPENRMMLIVGILIVLLNIRNSIAFFI